MSKTPTPYIRYEICIEMGLNGLNSIGLRDGIDFISKLEGLEASQKIQNQPRNKRGPNSITEPDQPSLYQQNFHF